MFDIVGAAKVPRERIHLCHLYPGQNSIRVTSGMFAEPELLGRIGSQRQMLCTSFAAFAAFAASFLPSKEIVVVDQLSLYHFA